MNWVDILIVVLLLGLGLFGWMNGLVRWAFTLAGGIIGVLLAGRLYTNVAPLVPVDNEGFQQIIAFGAIFLAIMVGAWVASKLVKTVLNVFMIGWVDHVSGAALGVVAGALTATAIISTMGIVPSESLQNSVNESTLAGPVVKNVGIALAFLPEEFQAVKVLVGAGGDD